MNRIKLIILLGCFMMSYSYTGHAAASHTLSLSPQDCTQINARLARLACFDSIFMTPLEKTNLVLSNNHHYSSQVWSRAQLNEQSRGEKTGFIRNDPNQHPTESEVWLTVADTQGAILMLSCLDNITRIELILPQPITLAKIPLQLSSDPLHQQLWIVEDDSRILRSPRGLPAIEMIKSMLHVPQITFYSVSKEFESRIFDTRELASLITPIRQACHW